MIAVASSLTEQVLNGSALLAFPIAVVAGIVAFLSPCVLPLVPAYLSYITGLTGLELTAKAARGRILWGTILFILGFSTVFISYGALFGGAGNVLLEQQSLVTKVLGVFTVLMGLAFLGALPNQIQWRPKIVTTWGLAGAPFLGVLFAVDSLYWSNVGRGPDVGVFRIICCAWSFSFAWVLHWFGNSIFNCRVGDRAQYEGFSQNFPKDNYSNRWRITNPFRLGASNRYLG